MMTFNEPRKTIVELSKSVRRLLNGTSSSHFRANISGVWGRDMSHELKEITKTKEKFGDKVFFTLIIFLAGIELIFLLTTQALAPF